MKRPEIRPLTSLRFFAAFWVVAYHYLTPVLRADPEAPGWLVTFVASGFVGVPLFFVLSGFVLYYNYERTDFQAPGARRAFYAARFARIYPVYILAFALSVPPALYALHTQVAGLPSPRDHIIGFVLSPVLLQSWAGSAYEAWNTPAWTISVEAVFYVGFPWLCGRAQRRGLGTVLAATTALSATILGAHLVAGIGTVDVAMRNPLVHVPSFVAGMFLAQRRHWTSGFGPVAADAWTSFGLLGIGALVLWLGGPFGFPPEVANPLLNSLLPIPFVAATVLGLCAPHGRIISALSAPLWVMLGNASYSVYILQAPVSKFALYLPALLLGSGTTNLPAVLVMAGILILGSLATYRFVERPWQRRIRAWVGPVPPLTAPASKGDPRLGPQAASASDPGHGSVGQS